MDTQTSPRENDIVITRFCYSDYGTFGILKYKDFQCFTAERSWENNEKNVSCIPEGEYSISWVDSPKFGRTIGIYGGTVSLFPDNEYERSAILFHLGNWPKNFQGCIGLGKEWRCVSGEIGISRSGETINEFLSIVNTNDKLIIKMVEGAT